MNIGCNFRLLLGVCFLMSPVVSFYPNRLGLVDLNGDDRTLEDITANGILLAVAKYFESTPLDGRPTFNPGDLTGLDPLTASNLYSAYYGDGNVSPKNFEAAIQEIVSENTKISNTKAEEALWHMNGEQLKKGNAKIIQMRGSLNGVLSETAPDYKIARLWIGRILHIMQMFYSNTDWLEMQIYLDYLKTKEIKPEVVNTYPKLGVDGKPFLAEEKYDDSTCLDCEGVYDPDSEGGEFESCFFNRHNAIKAIRYTSGYLSGQDVEKSDFGKCSHGGRFDDTRYTYARGGINKQTSKPTLSPHYYYHSDAARLAVAATTDFFVDPVYGLLDAIDEAHFRGIFNLGTGATLAMVIDDTGSMGEEISAVINECVGIVNYTAGTVDAPYNYVVVTFNDPDYGPALVTNDPDECITYLRGIYAHGGGDCPEFALSGVELALQNCLPNSDVLVFTDADAKDADKATSVAALAKKTKSRVRFVLTGQCSRRRRRRDTHSPYDLVAEESGGAVYEGGKDEISEIVKVLDLNVGAALVYIAKKEITNPQPLLFLIDETLTVFTITISGPSPKNAIIYTPTGMELDLTGPNVTVNVDSSSVFSIDVGTPERGEWKCANNDYQTYDVEVTSQSIVDFQYRLITVDETTGIANDVEGSPISGAELAINVKVFGVDYVSSVERVDLVSPVGEVIKQISLLEVETTASDTYSATFIVPSDTFSVHLQASDLSGNSLQRIQPTIVRPEVFQLVLISSDTDELNPGSSVVTTFKVINTGVLTEFNIVDLITGGETHISSSIYPSSVAASNSSDGNVTHVLYASSGAPIGTPITVTVRVEEPSSGSFNYIVFSISVAAVSTVVIDDIAPTLSSASETGLCSNDKLAQDICSDHTWSSIYQFTDDTEMGSVIFYPPIDIEETITYTTGTITATLTGTCCCPLLSVTGVDLSGNSLSISANVTEQNAPEPVCIPPEPTGLPPGAYYPTNYSAVGTDVVLTIELEEETERLPGWIIAVIVSVSLAVVLVVVVGVAFAYGLVHSKIEPMGKVIDSAHNMDHRIEFSNDNTQMTDDVSGKE